MADDRFDVEADCLTIGRTFAEYRRMLDLAPATLAGTTVLDCGGGAGAFTATANALGADATAIDPLYGPPAAELEPGLDEAVERTIEQVREKRDLFVWDYYGDVDTRERYLRAAYERFLADYAHHPGWYVEGALPDIPLDTGSVDLAVVTNLLFLYDDRLDLEFHVAALRELARVADEVRVFPTHSLERGESIYVDECVATLRTDGTDAGLRTVPYEFQPGATEMFVVDS
jgi:SAM-dependent methyltransferase